MESASRQTWPLTTKVDTIYVDYSTQILCNTLIPTPSRSCLASTYNI